MYVCINCLNSFGVDSKRRIKARIRANFKPRPRELRVVISEILRVSLSSLIVSLEIKSLFGLLGITKLCKGFL